MSERFEEHVAGAMGLCLVVGVPLMVVGGLGWAAVDPQDEWLMPWSLIFVAGLVPFWLFIAVSLGCIALALGRGMYRFARDCWEMLK